MMFEIPRKWYVHVPTCATQLISRTHSEIILTCSVNTNYHNYHEFFFYVVYNSFKTFFFDERQICHPRPVKTVYTSPDRLHIVGTSVLFDENVTFQDTFCRSNVEQLFSSLLVSFSQIVDFHDQN